MMKEKAHAKSKLCNINLILDRQNKFIELNKLKLVPEKELENSLNNLKYASKTVYIKDVESYLNTKHILLKQAGINL